MKKIFLVIISGLMLIVLILPLFLNRISEVYAGDGETYFTLKGPGFMFLGVQNEKGILGRKVLDFMIGSGGRLYQIKTRNGSSVAYIDSTSVKIYKEGVLSAAYNVSQSGKVIMYDLISDIDNDGCDEVFLILKNKDEEYGSNLLVLGFPGELKEIFNYQCKYLNPWKVQVCDVDGDKKKEVSLGVYTKAAFHQVMAKRPFIYDFKNNELYPKWLGSRLSKPFDDYCFVDMDNDGMDEIISIEILYDGQKELNSYKWKGFGFESIGNSSSYRDIKNLGTDGEFVSARVKEDKKWYAKEFKYANETLIENNR